MIDRSYKGQRKEHGDSTKIKVEGEGNKEREVTVRHLSPRWKGKSTWYWNEDLTREWSKAYLTRNRETILR